MLYSDNDMAGSICSVHKLKNCLKQIVCEVCIRIGSFSVMTTLLYCEIPLRFFQLVKTNMRVFH